jgi:hypothetical protein
MRSTIQCPRTVSPHIVGDDCQSQHLPAQRDAEGKGPLQESERLGLSARGFYKAEQGKTARRDPGRIISGLTRGGPNS